MAYRKRAVRKTGVAIMEKSAVEAAALESGPVVIDPTVARDDDGDGELELDPRKAQTTMVDLVLLDHRLRDEGSSLAEILRILAHTSQGIRI